MDMRERAEFWNGRHTAQDLQHLSGSDPSVVIAEHRLSDFLGESYKIVLDVGVGTGGMTQYLHDEGHWVWAVDISVVALSKAIARGASDTFLFPSEMERIPSNAVDVAIAHLVTMHNDDETVLLLLTHVIRSLKIGGVASIQNAYWPQSEGGSELTYWRSPASFDALVAKAGGRAVSRATFGPKDQRIMYEMVHVMRGAPC